MPGVRGRKEKLPELAEMWGMFESGISQSGVRNAFSKSLRVQKLHLIFKLDRKYPNIRIRQKLFEEKSIMFGPLNLEDLTDLFNLPHNEDVIVKRLTNDS